MNALDQLRARSVELTHLSRIMALMQWDQEVYMPARAAMDRAGQFGALSAVIHRKTVDPAIVDLFDLVEREPDMLEPDRALVRLMGRQYRQNKNLPEKFVAEFAELTSRAQMVWTEARRCADFTKFEPALEKIVAMSRQQADYLGYTTEPYDALLDLYEEGLTTTTLEHIFADLKVFLSDMVHEIGAKKGSCRIFKGELELASQKVFADQVLAKIGYDFSRGRQDISPHPFSTTLGHHDRRVTNRYQPDSLEFIFSALHEGGHGLYEQGTSETLANTCLDEGVSLGIHESQSRLWENIIGRSRPFWENLYPELQKAFPGFFDNTGPDEFLAVINTVSPGCIRVEADEVSYNLHVLVRFELEKELLRGNIKVKDLPALWNESYMKYLGVKVASDADGVLQDIHWSHGSFGYFPTYTIGNLAAAQIWNTYCLFDPDHDNTVRTGNYARIRQWLTAEIYQHGAIYPPDTLLRKVTGEPLNSRYFMDYLNNKYKN